LLYVVRSSTIRSNRDLVIDVLTFALKRIKKDRSALC
jgi:hypothetical protein